MDPLIVKISRLDRELPLPRFHTEGAAAIDLYARLDTTVGPHSFGYIPLNCVVQVPEGYWTLLAVRSSTHKTGLIPGNGLGIIDSDYCGPDDELKLVVYNTRAETVTVERGTRIAQMTVLPRPHLTVEEVELPQHKNRGAFGTTGHR